MADTDSEPQVPAEDEELARSPSHGDTSESGESEDSEESSEGSDMDVMEEACERGRETHPRVITSSWHIQLAYAAKKGECSWRSRIPQCQMERLRDAGWTGKCYLRLDGLVESFEEKLCFPTVGKHEKGATIVAYAMPLFQERFLPLWIKSPSAISSWINYVKKNDRGVNATHAEVRSLDCPFKHGPERLKWLQQIFAEQQYGGGGKCEWGYKRVTHCSMTVGDIFIMGELVYLSAFDGFWVVNLNGQSECIRVEDTFGAVLEEKASGSGDVRPDLRDALAASVAVPPPEPVQQKPKETASKGEKGKGKGKPQATSGKGGKGEEEQDGKGKGSNATGNVANDTEPPCNIQGKGADTAHQDFTDAKGGKGDRNKGHGKGKGKGKGKKGSSGYGKGADAAHQDFTDAKGGKGDRNKGRGKGKGKGKGKKGSSGYGKGADAAHQDFTDAKGGKGDRNKGHGKGKGKGKGKKGSSFYGKGADAAHQDFTDAKGGKGDRNKGHGKGKGKGKGKKGSSGYGKGNGKKGLDENLYM